MLFFFRKHAGRFGFSGKGLYLTGFFRKITPDRRFSGIHVHTATERKKIMNFRKGITKCIAAAISAVSVFAVSAAAYESVPISLDGKSVDLDARLIGSTTYVELSGAEKIFGTDDSSPAIHAAEGELYIESDGRYIGGAECLTLDGETFVPVRSFAKIRGADVEWNDETRSVALTTNGESLASGDDYYIDDEVYWLSRIISAEAEGEPMKGKILVGNVILNRVASDEFPDSIYDVIFDRKWAVQFTPTANGRIWNDPDSESVIAAKICLDAYYISREAMYFLNPRIATNFWICENRPFLMSVGGHDFYS